MTEKKSKRCFKTDDAVPNHVVLQGMNYAVTLGSFNRDVNELTRIGLRAMRKIKEIEEGEK